MSFSKYTILFLIFALVPFVNTQCCNSCGISPLRYCPTGGCLVSIINNVIVCTCNAGGSCYDKLWKCNGVCPTTTTTIIVTTVGIITKPSITTKPSNASSITINIVLLCFAMIFVLLQ